MSRTIRFHLDENVDPAIVHGLRLRGIDVTTTFEARLTGRTDDEQLNFARREGRVLVMFDEDFLARAASGIEHAGICYCFQGNRQIGSVVRTLELMWELLDPDEMMNGVEYL